MGIAERKKREREQKRQLMLEAAEELILEKGLDQLNMDEVAVRSEFSKGSLYQYFKNKNDLVLGICHKATSLLSDEISKVLTQDKPGLDLVSMIGATYISFALNHSEYFKAMKYHDNLIESNELESSEYLESCMHDKQSSFTCMVRAIQIGMQDGSISTRYDAHELALLLWGTSQGMVDLAYKSKQESKFNLLDDLGVSIDSMFNNYITMIGSGIAQEGYKVVVDSESKIETNGRN